LAALKKQYREDLEALTGAYEARRRVLKDALHLYSTNGANLNATAAVAVEATAAASGGGKGKASRSRHEEK
jgi:hypothetical protein